ncbi:unnamed protein product, partial [Rotaria magnacalcarata]
NYLGQPLNDDDAVHALVPLDDIFTDDSSTGSITSTFSIPYILLSIAISGKLC